MSKRFDFNKKYGYLKLEKIMKKKISVSVRALNVTFCFNISLLRLLRIDLFQLNILKTCVEIKR